MGSLLVVEQHRQLIGSTLKPEVLSLKKKKKCFKTHLKIVWFKSPHVEGTKDIKFAERLYSGF